MVQARPLPPVWEIELQGRWRQMDDALAALIVSALDAGHAKVQFQMGRKPHVIDFRGMVQVNLETGVKHKIRRRRPEVDVADPSNVIRIDSWPATRLPEGHTCGNELWIPLCDSEAELAERLRMSVGSFEAGFALS
uniref:WWE domain-containing protein n=1 Tax=Alexandrium andersonii TaxID=327968 RepID=A0A7S2GL91_9DINO